MEDAEASDSVASEMSAMEEDDDQGEWKGISGSKESNGTVLGDSHGGTKLKKPPTGEELRTIKDASDLFKSSSFKLQVRVLIPVSTSPSITPPTRSMLSCLTCGRKQRERRPSNTSYLLYIHCSRSCHPSLLNIHSKLLVNS